VRHSGEVPVNGTTEIHGEQGIIGSSLCNEMIEGGICDADGAIGGGVGVTIRSWAIGDLPHTKRVGGGGCWRNI
jgi:hypothetical protein